MYIYLFVLSLLGIFGPQVEGQFVSDVDVSVSGGGTSSSQVSYTNSNGKVVTKGACSYTNTEGVQIKIEYEEVDGQTEFTLVKPEGLADPRSALERCFKNSAAEAEAITNETMEKLALQQETLQKNLAQQQENLHRTLASQQEDFSRNLAFQQTELQKNLAHQRRSLQDNIQNMFSNFPQFPRVPYIANPRMPAFPAFPPGFPFNN